MLARKAFFPSYVVRYVGKVAYVSSVRALREPDDGNHHVSRHTFSLAVLFLKSFTDQYIIINYGKFFSSLIDLFSNTLKTMSSAVYNLHASGNRLCNCARDWFIVISATIG